VPASTGFVNASPFDNALLDAPDLLFEHEHS
jgi:hypothetical protein